MIPATLCNSANLTAAQAPLECPMMMVWWSTAKSSFMKGNQMDLLAVMGSGMFLRTLQNPGISFNLLLTQPYQLDLVTSPEPLPGTMTALTATVDISFSLVEVNQAIL